MMSADDLKDPAVNYTARPNRPTGARMAEYPVRQLLGFALQQIRAHVDDVDDNIIDQLFAIHGPAVIAQVKGYFRDHEKLSVVVGWPRTDMAMPWIAVVNATERDNDAESILGSQGGVQVLGRAGGLLEQRNHMVRPLSASLNILIASLDPHLTAVLSQIVRFILHINEDSLAEFYDVQVPTISMQDVQWDEKLWPTFGFFRMVTLNYATSFDYNVSKEAQRIVSLGLLVSTRDQENVETITPVPTTDE